MRIFCKSQVIYESLCLHTKQERAGFDIRPCTGLAGTFEMQQVIEEGNDVHVARNTKMHTDDQGLRKDAKFLQRRGFVEMMKEEMPYQCALVMNLQWILSSTHRLSHAT